MTKRTVVPRPFPRLHPSVARGLASRLMLAATMAAAFALIGGSSYLLSHTLHTAPTAQPQPKLSQPQPASAKVLGAATTTPNPNPTDTPPAASTQPSSAPSPAATLPDRPATGSQLCALTCIPGYTAPTPSFDLIIDQASARKSLLGLQIPFHVVRHGGLATPIQLGTVSLTMSGQPTGLLRVQSAVMLSSDRGLITIINLGLPLDSVVSGSVSASSNGLTASTSFSL